MEWGFPSLLLHPKMPLKCCSCGTGWAWGWWSAALGVISKNAPFLVSRNFPWVATVTLVILSPKTFTYCDLFLGVFVPHFSLTSFTFCSSIIAHWKQVEHFVLSLSFFSKFLSSVSTDINMLKLCNRMAFNSNSLSLLYFVIVEVGLLIFK